MKITKELESLVTEAKSMVPDDLEEGTLMPSWIILDEEGTHHMLATPFKDDREKNLTLGLVKDFMLVQRATCYVFICEAWVVTRPKDFDQSELEKIMPSEQEDKQSGIIISGEDRLGSILSQKIMNDNEDWNDTFEAHSGNFFNLLPTQDEISSFPERKRKDFMKWAEKYMRN